MKLFSNRRGNITRRIYSMITPHLSRPESVSPASVGIPQLADCKDHFLHVVTVRPNLELADLAVYS